MPSLGCVFFSFASDAVRVLGSGGVPAGRVESLEALVAFRAPEQNSRSNPGVGEADKLFAGTDGAVRCASFAGTVCRTLAGAVCCTSFSGTATGGAAGFRRTAAHHQHHHREHRHARRPPSSRKIAARPQAPQFAAFAPATPHQSHPLARAAAGVLADARSSIDDSLNVLWNALFAPIGRTANPESAASSEAKGVEASDRMEVPRCAAHLQTHACSALRTAFAIALERLDRKWKLDPGLLARLIPFLGHLRGRRRRLRLPPVRNRPRRDEHRHIVGLRQNPGPNERFFRSAFLEVQFQVGPGAWTIERRNNLYVVTAAAQLRRQFLRLFYSASNDACQRHGFQMHAAAAAELQMENFVPANPPLPKRTGDRSVPQISHRLNDRK